MLPGVRRNESRLEAERAIAQKDQTDKAKRAADRQRMSDSWDHLKGQYEEKVKSAEERLRKEQDDKKAIVADLEKQERAIKSLEEIKNNRPQSVPPPAQQCGGTSSRPPEAQPLDALRNARASSVPPVVTASEAPAQPAAKAPPPPALAIPRPRRSERLSRLAPEVPMVVSPATSAPSPDSDFVSIVAVHVAQIISIVL